MDYACDILYTLSFVATQRGMQNSAAVVVVDSGEKEAALHALTDEVCASGAGRARHAI